METALYNKCPQCGARVYFWKTHGKAWLAACMAESCKTFNSLYPQQGETPVDAMAEFVAECVCMGMTAAATAAARDALHRGTP